MTTAGQLIALLDNWPEEMPVAFVTPDEDLELVAVYDSEAGATLLCDFGYLANGMDDEGDEYEAHQHDEAHSPIVFLDEEEDFELQAMRRDADEAFDAEFQDWE
ncbi:MAG: hypothetical protein ACRDL7_15030 [Gaiellaceae bacterium]